MIRGALPFKSSSALKGIFERTPLYFSANICLAINPPEDRMICTKYPHE